MNFALRRSAPAQTETPGSRVFRKQLGFWSLLAISVGNIIGSGWLFAAMYASSIAGPASILSWLIATGLVVLIALIYADLAKMRSEAGATVRYSAYSHGLYSAGLISFGTFLALVAGGGSEVTAVLTYLSHFWPALIDPATQGLTAIGGALAIVLLLAFTGVALAGVRWFARTNLPWTTLKVIVPLLTMVMFLIGAFNPGNFTAPRLGGFMPFGMAGLFAAIPTSGMMYAYGGFRRAIDFGSESTSGVSPRRVLLSAVGITAIIYVGLQVAWIAALPAGALSHGWGSALFSSPWTTLAVGINLTWLSTVLYVDSVVSPSGVMLVAVNSGARITYSMSNPSRLLPPALGKLSRRGVPFAALWVNVLLSVISILILHSWHAMVAVLSVLIGVEYGIGAVAVTVLAKRGSLPPRRGVTRLIAPTAFVIAGLITYWAGWDYIRIGFPALVVISSLAYWWSGRQSPRSRRELLGGIWLVPYLGAILVVSLLGSYKGGLDVIPAPWDSILVGSLTLLFYHVGVRAGLWYTRAEEWREVQAELQAAAADAPATVQS